MACAERAPAARGPVRRRRGRAARRRLPCRTQVRQAGEREPVHLAQIAARALRPG
ncbi:hypothetical protein HBB16_06125 [Pseudonocardia sp. MCCB 268]|nr:hypothetical protein [Pseudonocardia cytotoxica]